MHSILHYEHPDLTNLRHNALSKLQTTADMFLQLRSIVADPLSFLVHTSARFHHPHITISSAPGTLAFSTAT